MKNKVSIIMASFFEGIPGSKLIFGAFIVSLTGFVLYQSLLAGQIEKLKRTRLEFITQKKLIDSYSRLLMSKGELADDLKLKENNFAGIKEKFIPEEELSNYFVNFRSLAKAFNLEVVNLDFKPQEPIKGKDGKQLTYFKKMSLDVSLKGGYFDAMSLFYKLEQNSLIFDKKSIRILQENPGSSVIVMEIKASVYVLMKSIQYDIY